ncbi:MAG: hypothetical protein QHH43_04985 [Candidatus Saccharicenans sp.]|nr:hypothetical protein [Candidatus Saccharicenans sp.]MDH7575098.1 hypothetical protein [Candidatus Saccharicenans sp.]
MNFWSTRRGGMVSYFPIFILLVSALVVTCGLKAADVVVYDFVKKAPEAKWYRSISAAGELPWNGADNDSRGFARHVTNAVLEDGQTIPQVLQTHPEWKNDGNIIGVFPGVKIPAGATFKATVGFLKGATQSDGVKFYVSIVSAGGGAVMLAEVPARYDGKLDQISVDLSPYAGSTVDFRLSVSAAGRSVQDWAVWGSASIYAPLAVQKVGQVADLSKTKVQATTPQKPAGGVDLQLVKPSIIKTIPLNPAGVAPSRHKVEDIGPLNIEEPMTLLNRVFKDNEKPNTYYYLPREINLVRDRAAGGYRISAVWTNDQRVKTTMTLKANVDPADVKLMEEALKAARGQQAVLRSLPYDEAAIIDMQGWEDWEIENIRIPSFGSLETELPINIAMAPDTLAELKPLLEKEGLTAGMKIKSGTVEREIPIRVGLKYFTGRWYSGVEELGFSIDEKNSVLYLHGVRNLSDFPIKVNSVSLRFRLPNGEDVYKNLKCLKETVIQPGQALDLEVQFVPRGLLLAEYRKAFPTAPPAPKKKSSLLEKSLGALKSELEKKLDKDKVQEAEGLLVKDEVGQPASPKVDAFFKQYARSFWMEIEPDFNCQPCLDKIWSNIEVVSYIERMRKLQVEVLASVFDPAAYDSPLEVEKVRVEIRSPYLSAQGRSGLVTGIDFNKNKLKELVTVYMPMASGEQFNFEYKIKAVLKDGQIAESASWETVTDSLDLTIGPYHIKNLFGR